MNLDDFFVVICTSFHESYSFHQICKKKKEKKHEQGEKASDSMYLEPQHLVAYISPPRLKCVAQKYLNLTGISFATLYVYTRSLDYLFQVMRSGQSSSLASRLGDMPIACHGLTWPRSGMLKKDPMADAPAPHAGRSFYTATPFSRQPRARSRQIRPPLANPAPRRSPLASRSRQSTAGEACRRRWEPR